MARSSSRAPVRASGGWAGPTPASKPGGDGPSPPRLDAGGVRLDVARLGSDATSGGLDAECARSGPLAGGQDRHRRPNRGEMDHLTPVWTPPRCVWTPPAWVRTPPRRVWTPPARVRTPPSQVWTPPPPGLDAWTVGLDATRPGLDAWTVGLDATHPGLDAAHPGLDATHRVWTPPRLKHRPTPPTSARGPRTTPRPPAPPPRSAPGSTPPRSTAPRTGSATGAAPTGAARPRSAG